MSKLIIVSEKPAASGDTYSTTACCAWSFAAALLALRLCLGLHFFSEGTSKLSYDQGQQKWDLNAEFTAKTEALFRNATGPLADVYQGMLPGFYDWQNLLAVPHKSEPLSSAEIEKRQAWQRDYASRRAKAQKAKEPLPIEFPEYAPYSQWAENIVTGLRQNLKTFTDLPGISDEQDAEAAKKFVQRHQQLADFLEEESQAIEDYQHELWRLEQMEGQGGADEIPFRKKRVASKRSEATGLGSRLVSQVSGIQTGFNTDLRSVLTDEQREDVSFLNTVDQSLTSGKARRMRWLNLAVTGLVIAVGVCLLLGLLTRLACLGAILFLLSVMVTQLPWVPGSNSMFFYYQLVECAALVALACSKPWQLPGVDYLLSGFGSKRRSAAKG